MKEPRRSFTVGTVGVSPRDSVLLKALINLMPATGGLKWTYVGPSAATVVVVDIDSPEGAGYLGSHPQDLLIVLGDAYDGSHPHLSKPIRNSSLRELLAGIARDMQQTSAAPQPAPRPAPQPASRQAPRQAAPVPAAEAVDPLSPRGRLEALKQRMKPQPARKEVRTEPVAPAESGVGLHSLLERLDRAIAKHKTLFTWGTTPLFATDPESDLGFVKGGLDSLLVLKQADKQGIDVERISSRKLSLFREQAEEVPLDRLRWFGGVNFSGGRLLRGVAEWPAYRLRRWPDFGRLPYRREFARMARLLMTRPASVEQLVVRGGISDREVAGFLNAAYLCGWLERAAAAATTPVKAPLTQSPRSGLIAKLRTSLGM